ncbi:MAG: hypothetical protein NXI09_07840 [Bacteroidetes bacterium]|nr:hypothetical protein [Bacteroidota bacterium]
MQRILLIAAFLSLNLVYAQDSIPKKFLNDIEFRSIGPAGMSGRITAIKVDPRNENHIYAGSASGGLWESRNGGTSWDCIFNNEAVSSVGAIALDPHNPDLIWLGTGEGNPRNSNTGGAGLYRSLDGGKTWKLMGLEQSRHIHRVIVHPHQSNTIYVAAIGNPWADSEHRGVYKSTDGGESWERILYNNERTGAAEMVMDPQNPEKLIVNMWEHRRNPWFFKSGGKGSGLYITYDGGKTWEQKTEKHGLPKGELGRMGIAIAASQPDRIYALVEKKGKNALYRSDNGGAKWRMISQDENIGNRPFYYAEIYVDPQNENRVYSIWSVISRSEDGGKNWQVIAPYNYIHPDHHAFFIHPENPSYIINGNDGGLNISRDRGESWRFVNNLPLAQFYHISYDMETPYNVYGGMQDNGSWKGPAYVFKADGIRNDYWEELFFGDGFDVSVDPSNSRYVYAMSQEGYLGRVDTKTGYTTMIRPVHPENKDLRFNWNAPIAQDPFEDGTIYFGAQYVFKSKDRGANWEVISPDLTTNDSTKQNYGESGGLTYDVTGAENYTTLLCIEPGDKQGELWVSSDDGRLHLTKDGGGNWTELSDNLQGMPAGAWIPQIVHSKHKEGAAFVVANDYRRGDERPMLFYTENYGKSFKNIGASLPAYVISVVQDIENPNLIFVGTQRGLFFSWDMGEHWQKWSKDFPTVPVSDLKIHPREDDLIVGTFGRAAWILDDLGPLRQSVELSMKSDLDKLELIDIEGGYKFAYKRADGSRFPADGVFKGDNRSNGLKVFLVNSFKKEDSLKSKQIKFEIHDENGLLSTQYRKASEGLKQYRLSLYASGIGFPSQDRKLTDTTERSAAALPLGTYTIRVNYGGVQKEGTYTYEIDPRLEDRISARSIEDQYHWKMNLDGSLREINQVADALKEAKLKIRISEDIAELKLEPKELKAYQDSLKPLKKDLKKFEEEMYGRKVDGYYDQPNTLQSQYYAISRYTGYSWDGVPSQAEILQKQYKETEKRFIEDWQKFEDQEWPNFEALRKQFNLKLDN